MPPFGDQDGKSKTASAVDAEHYPPIGKQEHDAPPPPVPYSKEDIAARAHQIWLEEGCPEGAAEAHWLEAERQLKDAALSRRLTAISHEKGGSVQN